MHGINNLRNWSQASNGWFSRVWVSKWRPDALAKTLLTAVFLTHFILMTLSGCSLPWSHSPPLLSTGGTFSEFSAASHFDNQSRLIHSKSDPEITVMTFRITGTWNSGSWEAGSIVKNIDKHHIIEKIAILKLMQKFERYQSIAVAGSN